MSQGVENLEPYDMVLDSSLLVISITYTNSRITIEGIPTRGRTREQIMRDEGWYRD